MASIERTAYPRIKQTLSKSELQEFYTPTLEEKFFISENARIDNPADRAGIERKKIAVNQPAKAFAHAENLKTFADSCSGDSADGGIHSWRVAAAG